jgi:photosystem II stability/assembly factor-like uncharacterized protein
MHVRYQDLLKFFALCLTSFIMINAASAQSITLLTTKDSISIRGLSAVNDKIVWVSGSKGSVARSIDGGKTWKWMRIPGFEKTDFRDIEAFSASTAVIMGVSSPAYILRTNDAGATWKTVYVNQQKEMFLDAMEFWNEQSGIVIGDPINNRFYIARTFDGGKTWRDIPEQNKPLADSGEACFASSGTNIRKLNKEEAVFVSGGSSAHFFIRDKKNPLPLITDGTTSGANSIAVKNSKTMIVVGGDFSKKDSTRQNCLLTTDGGNTWTAPASAPTGYRSCVEYLRNNEWITCGLNGVDITTDDGNHWKNISTESFNVCRKAKKGSAVFLAGGGGKIGKLNY